MAVPYFKYDFEQDLQQPILTQYGGGLMFTGDSNATNITVTVTDGGSPYTLSGTCEMVCIRADGVTVRITGSTSGNVASCRVSADCCAVDGRITIFLKVTENSVTTTLLKANYIVDQGQTDNEVIPPTIQVLPVTRGGTGITANPSMLINLASTNAAGVFQTNPRPGITGTLPIANGGTGGNTANIALSNLTSAMPYNGNWKDAPLGMSIYYYDTNSASTYDVPSGASFVVVIRHQYSNAIAMCFKYTSNPQLISWNRKNGSNWSGWDHLVLTGSLSNNNSTYINTVDGSWERHDKVVTFTCQFTIKTAFSTALGTAISGLPASAKMSTFLVNEHAGYTANFERTASVYNGYIYLGGPFTTGITYTVSGSYVI